MSNPTNSDALRTAASEWTLEGDRTLLNLLQNLHEKITTKCCELDGRLNVMVSSLDDASVSLQNVNNRFAALSNSQFIESRVYEDDTDVATEKEIDTPKPTQPDSKSRVSSLEASIDILSRLHESVAADSDTDTDSDTEREGPGVILKPKNLYEHRPLPYIIGSHEWRNKWHAGLVIEDSDTDSQTSHRDAISDAYSESDEQSDRVETKEWAIESSSEQSDTPSLTEPVVQPADIFRPAMDTVYKPYCAPSVPIFSEEPPPLAQTNPQSDESYGESETEDIFAELSKHATNAAKNKTKNPVASLFVEHMDEVPKQVATETPPVFQENEDSNLFTDKISNNAPIAKQENIIAEGKSCIKKPAGAISMFGSNKGTENIGAAILKRNQRKSSSSDDESIDNIDKNDIIRRSVDKQVDKPKVVEKTDIKTVKVEEKAQEKSIFDELFAKSEVKTQQAKSENKKVDLFSDIFDDIDDIFTSKPKTNDNKNKKSIFDDEDDDLFSDIGVSVKSNSGKQSKAAKAGDDLFSDSENNEGPTNIEKESSKNITNPPIVKNDELIRDSLITLEKPFENKATKSKSIFEDSEDKLFKSTAQIDQTVNKPVTKELNIQQKTNSIFDSDSDDGDLFSDLKPKAPTENREKDKHSFLKKDLENKPNLSEDIKVKSDESHKAPKEDLLKPKQSLNISSPLLFDDDDDDDLFTTVSSVVPSKQSVVNEVPKEIENIDGTNNTQLKPETSTSGYMEYNHKLVLEDKLNFDGEQFHPSFASENDNISPSIIATQNLEHDYKGKQNIVVDSSKSEFSVQIQDRTASSNEIVKEANKQADLNQDNIKPVERVLNENPIISELETENKSMLKEKPNLEDIIKPPNLTKPTHHDVFDDIFSEPPPIFEKTKEVKTPQNVNALFGDDSDDEALFFKKEVPVTDEKPKDIRTPNKETPFSIFHGEPPDLDDVDDSIDFLAQPVQSKVKSNDSTDGETKHIGKLKPTQLNINVNTLLPGASPKKVLKTTKVEEANKVATLEPKLTEALTKDSPKKSVETTNAIESKTQPETKLVKSVSFDSDPDSLILNNNLSKERAKIQVKRRPSSRRARKEASRKSGIDFGDDSTDNSTSIEESKLKTNVNIESKDTKSNIDVVEKVLNINDEDVYIFKEPKKPLQDMSTNPKKHTEIATAKLENRDLIDTVEKTTVDNLITRNKPVTGTSDSDDDLFKSTKSVENKQIETGNTKQSSTKSKPKKSLFDDLSDDENLFGAQKKNTVTTSIFSDSDEELFASGSSSKSTKDVKKIKVDKNKSLFDDDDDGDLFGRKKKIEKESKSPHPKATSSKESSIKSAETFEDPLSMFED